jgi:hypothetical protein
MLRIWCSRWTGFGVHDGPENARMDPRKFGVMVAQNRGVKVESFTDFQAAEEWLLR